MTVLAFALTFLILTLISLITLLIVIPIARKVADFSMPPWPETLWKLAVVAGVVNAISLGLAPVNIVVSWIVATVVFWVIMVKWFDVDLFGAIIIVIVSSLVRIVVSTVVVDGMMALVEAGNGY